MAAEAITVARPWAEAVFARADETGRLAEWGERLELLAALVSDRRAHDFLSNPAIDPAQKVELILAVAGDRLDDEGRNLVRLLVEKGRLELVPWIARLYRNLRDEREGRLAVSVATAQPLDDALQARLAQMLEQRLGREVTLESHTDPALIGGVVIRAGDQLIDASVSGQLARLANELGIQG